MGNEQVVEYIKRRALEIDKKINKYLTDKTSVRYLETLLGRSGYQYDPKAINKAVIEPAKYLLDLGGKRWRPVLMLAVIDTLGKDSNEYLEFSIIPEIIHNATLIHDDIEDRSEMRRGSPAVHMKYGVDVALNLGDFMYFFPIVALLDSNKLDRDTKIKFLEIYQKEMLKVTIGQATDIAWHNFLVDPTSVSESEYLQMAYSKTGVLASMSAKLGAVLGGADDKTISALGNFGASIGVAFQLQDDLLNVVKSGVSESKGGTGDDITEGKITLLTTYTLEKAEKRDRERLIEILKMHTTERTLIDEAIEIIGKYGAIDYAKNLEQKLVKDAWKNVDGAIPDSDAKKVLKSMAEFLISRSI
ncbi:MAG: polyprenyl synthetase family protein [Candidatus Micrarchaeota archaeon]|nr:polyprenyl synthetase family protein [Candidatus Micrarchaeota archaeon]